MHLVENRGCTEAAIGTGDHVFAPQDAGEPHDPLGDELRMFDQ